MNDLPAIRNYFFDEAERRWWWSLFLTLAVQLSALAVIWLNASVILVVAGTISFLAPIGVVWLREWAAALFDKGDKCRRLILYADGLGEEIPPEELTLIRSWPAGTELKEAPFERPYYTSKLSPGPNRLADIITESAFFTSFLSGKTADYLLRFLIIFGLILIITLYVAVDVQKNATTLSLITKSIIVTIALLFLGDLLFLWQKYAQLSRSAQQTFQKCAQLRQQRKLELFKVMQAVEDYHLKLVESPPIPAKLHRMFYQKLNKLYRESHSIDTQA